MMLNLFSLEILTENLLFMSNFSDKLSVDTKLNVSLDQSSDLL